MTVSRPTVQSITITFTDHDPVKIDPSEAICLFWRDEGVDVLTKFYELTGQPEKAEKVREMWTPLSGGVKEDPTGPAVISKDAYCFPKSWP